MSETTTVLTLADAERLAEQTWAAIEYVKGWRNLNTEAADRDRVASDLAGIRRHQENHVGTCSVDYLTWPCDDARRYSDGLHRTGALYGVGE